MLRKPLIFFLCLLHLFTQTAFAIDFLPVPSIIMPTAMPFLLITDQDYNELGWLVQEKNPLGFRTKYSYDKNGNVEKIERQADYKAALWQTTSFTYDILNH